MEGSPGPSDLQEQLKEREAEVGVLRNRLSQAQEEIDQLRRENEQLRQELRASGRGRARGQSKRKAKRKRSGRTNFWACSKSAIQPKALSSTRYSIWRWLNCRAR